MRSRRNSLRARRRSGRYWMSRPAAAVFLPIGVRSSCSSGMCSANARSVGTTSSIRIAMASYQRISRRRSRIRAACRRDRTRPQGRAGKHVMGYRPDHGIQRGRCRLCRCRGAGRCEHGFRRQSTARDGALLATNHLVDPLRSRDWAAFARGYNGPAYAKNRYDQNLAGAYARYSTGPLPDLSVRAPQLYLGYLDYMNPVPSTAGSASARVRH